MEYEPREGEDYIIDLYQITAVPQDADPEAIKQALNERTREYHPDLLQGRAPEVQRAGERMSQLLNRARVILLDEEKRSEYDQILTSWKGPVSTNGIPVIRLDDDIRATAAMKSPEELEAAFTAQTAGVAGMVHHNPKQQAMLGRLLETAEGEDAEELREAYDDALLTEDRVLAIEESERGRLLGLQNDPRYETSLGYAETMQVAIEGARTTAAEEQQRRALGGVSIRLAILSGQPTTESQAQTDLVATSGVLPHYFDEQAKKVTELAARREALLEKRLAIFQPTYPIAELQTEAQPNFAIGIKKDVESAPMQWIGFNFIADTMTLNNIDVPAEITKLLASAEYAQAYAKGYNVLTFVTKDQIELKTLLDEAYNKHLQKYYPDLFKDEEESE